MEMETARNLTFYSEEERGAAAFSTTSFIQLVFKTKEQDESPSIGTASMEQVCPSCGWLCCTNIISRSGEVQASIPYNDNDNNKQGLVVISSNNNTNHY
jgi:anaerobic selenocysteine-containing dehydrogenase